MTRAVLRIGLILLCCAGSGLAQQVELPLNQYLELYDRAHPKPEPEPEPPVAWTLDEAWIEIVTGEESARVTQNLVVTLLDDGWHEIPIPAAGTFVGAELGKLEGRVSEASGYKLVVRGSGRHTVGLESLVRVTHEDEATRQTWRMRFLLPAAAVVNGVVRTGEEIREVEVAAGGLVRGTDEAGGVLFAGEPGRLLSLELLGEARRSASSDLPLGFQARSATLLTFERSRTTVQGWLDLEVLQGALSELRLPIPPGFEPADVRASMLAGWHVAPGADGSELVVSSMVPLEGRWSVEIELVGEPREQAECPSLVPAGAASVLVAAAAEIREVALLELVEAGSARRPDARERKVTPEAFRATAHSWLIVGDPATRPSWAVTWPSKAEVLATQIDEVLVDVLVGEGGTAQYQVWVALRSSGAIGLELTMPSGFELLYASRDGSSVSVGSAGSGQTGEWVMVPLVARQGRQVVFLTGLVPMSLPTGDGSLSIPIPELSAPATRIAAQVSLPTGPRYRWRDLDRVGQVGDPPVPKEAPVLRSSALRNALGLAIEEERIWGELPEAGAGFVELGASWSALSTRPEPLVIDIEADEVKAGWL